MKNADIETVEQLEEQYHFCSFRGEMLFILKH